jgi:hypothetical protein
MRTRIPALAGHIAAIIVVGSATLTDGPSQCLTSEDPGSCVDCCKEATGLTGAHCGRYCHANVPPPPSPDEPVP